LIQIQQKLESLISVNGIFNKDNLLNSISTGNQKFLPLSILVSIYASPFDIVDIPETFLKVCHPNLIENSKISYLPLWIVWVYIVT
jgi:hypothetical protein